MNTGVIIKTESSFERKVGGRKIRHSFGLEPEYLNGVLVCSECFVPITKESWTEEECNAYIIDEVMKR